MCCAFLQECLAFNLEMLWTVFKRNIVKSCEVTGKLVSTDEGTRDRGRVFNRKRSSWLLYIWRVESSSTQKCKSCVQSGITKLYCSCGFSQNSANHIKEEGGKLLADLKMLKQSFLKPEAVMLHLPLVFKKQFKVITPPHADFAIILKMTV